MDGVGIIQKIGGRDHLDGTGEVLILTRLQSDQLVAVLGHPQLVLGVRRGACRVGLGRTDHRLGQAHLLSHRIGADGIEQGLEVRLRHPTVRDDDLVGVVHVVHVRTLREFTLGDVARRPEREVPVCFVLLFLDGRAEQRCAVRSGQCVSMLSYPEYPVV